MPIAANESVRCCAEWDCHARCRCGAQAGRPGRRTKNGVATMAFDVPRWSLTTTRVADGNYPEDADPAASLLQQAQACLLRLAPGYQ
jgi:hypothetical protein